MSRGKYPNPAGRGPRSLKATPAGDTRRAAVTTAHPNTCWCHFLEPTLSRTSRCGCESSTLQLELNSLPLTPAKSWCGVPAASHTQPQKHSDQIHTCLEVHPHAPRSSPTPLWTAKPSQPFPGDPFPANGGSESSTLWNLVRDLSPPPLSSTLNSHPIYLSALLSVSNLLVDGLQKCTGFRMGWV